MGLSPVPSEAYRVTRAAFGLPWDGVIRRDSTGCAWLATPTRDLTPEIVRALLDQGILAPLLPPAHQSAPERDPRSTGLRLVR